MNHCNICLDKAISETPNGVVSEVDLASLMTTCRVCVRCGHAYCQDHASPVDQASQCLTCLPLESIEIKEEPLKGDDGVTHRGKHLIPTGPHYRTLPKAISELTDEELEQFLTETANLIHKTEQIQDYRRISLSTARLEKADREDSKLRQARALQASLPRKSKVVITGQKGKGTSSSTVADFAAFIKFAREQLAAKKASVPVPPKSGATPSPVIGATDVKSPAKAEAPENESEIERLLGDE